MMAALRSCSFGRLTCARPLLRLHRVAMLSTAPPEQPPSPPQPHGEQQPLWKREKVLNVPNMLSLGRVAATPVIGYMVVNGEYKTALGLFVAAGITDLIDGWIARTFNQKTVFGAALDPFADKLLMVTLTLSTWSAGLIGTPAASLIIARDAIMIVVGFYLRYISLPAPKTMSRYFDVQLPSVELRPTLLSKYNTAFQLTLLGSVLAGQVFGFGGHWALHGLEYLVIGTTVASGLDYVFNRKKYVVFVRTPPGW